MKSALCMILVCGVMGVSSVSYAQIDIFGKVSSEVNRKVDETVDDALHPKPKEDPNAKKDDQAKTSSSASATSAANSTSSANATVSSAQTIKAYNNFDFKAGDTIIFADDFRSDQDGEFPSHWDLANGQGVVNKVNGDPAFLLTDGNYAMVSPRIKNQTYLSDPFTIEFDYYQANSSQYPPIVRLTDADGSTHDVRFGRQVEASSFPHSLTGNDVFTDEEYYGKWHHAAIIYKHDQMKLYVDNVRALVMPHCDISPVSMAIGGIGDASLPITFKNVRIARGGSDNLIGDLMTNGRFVTNGITFDIAKTTLRPQSMGVLNEVAKYLQSNASVRLEIDGHTDSDGDAASNQTLSEGRAASVKTQLVAMGIDASRLQTKGFGASKPIAPNTTLEGKESNRRVEFVTIH